MVRPPAVGRIALLGALAGAALVAAPSGAATVAPSFGTGPAAFVVSAAPSELYNSDFAGEPSLGVSWKSGNALFMANTSTYKIRFDDHATPPTVSWSDVSSPYSVFNVDPILATDPDTGVTLAGGDDGGCAVMSRTVDDGESWSAALPCTVVIDHPTVGIGPFAGTPPLGSNGDRIAYLCQQYPEEDECARSLDGGSTWSPATPVRGCIGLFGHVKVAVDGTAYVPNSACALAGSVPSYGVGGFVSKDNGLTWNGYTIPGALFPGRGFDPSVGLGTDGAVFEAWSQHGDAHPVVAVSTDATVHWTKPFDLAGTVSPPLVGSSFPTMVAGGPGRASVAYLGTRHVPAQGTSPYDDKDASWDLYVSTTFDGGKTWSTTQVTTDPVQRGPIADGGVAATTGRNLLDFMDAGVTREGRVVVAFADGCTDHVQCVDGATSTDAHATVAYQSAGRGMFAQYDR
jgi:hypothetical protein